jgi:hypothetical protein
MSIERRKIESILFFRKNGTNEKNKMPININTKPSKTLSTSNPVFDAMYCSASFVLIQASPY